MDEKNKIFSSQDAEIKRKEGNNETAKIKGRYIAKCFDKNGKLKWEDTINNTVVTAGKNLLLDSFLAGSSYTVTGPYMGLISSVGYSAIAAEDTMASHAGWAEAGVSTDYPLYNGNRKTCAWSSATGGAKSLSASLSFLCETTGGTVKGCFIVLGTGAVATKGDTNGTLFSAGTFTGGDKVLAVGDTLQVSFSVSL